MSINIGPPAVEELRPRITVIGIGGAGGNAITNMINAQIEGVDFIVANTDAQALNNAAAEHRIQLGSEITQGLGAGARPEVGRAAAEESLNEIDRALDGVHMCFIAAGMGGGTGTGAAPVIAKAARDKGVLTVGVVTKPFLFEGTRRMRAADAGIEELQKHVDTLIVIPNQNLFLVAKAETTFKEAFMMADEVLQQGVRSITDLMVMPGLINLDFADVRSVMGEMGKAMMGTGEGSGENRALEAAERAIANPLLDGVSMQGAKGVIISIIGGDDMKLLEVDEAANHIRELVDPNANIIWGSAFNPDLNGKIRVSVVATGIEQGGEVTGEAAARSFNLGGSRPPARPVPAETVQPLFERAEPEPEPAPEPEPEVAEEPEAEALELGSDFEEETAAEEAEQAEAEVEAEVDEGESDEAVAESADDDWDNVGEPAAANDENEPLELRLEAPEGMEGGEEAAPEDDGLLSDASRLADEDQPVASPLVARRRGLVAGHSDEIVSGNGPGGESGASSEGGGGGGGESGGGKSPRLPLSGNTLFERMANLSRGGPKEDDDEEEEGSGGSSLSIPRFLGRQNNQ